MIIAVDPGFGLALLALVTVGALLNLLRGRAGWCRASAKYP